MTSPKPGVWVYDLGQNFSGWMRLKVRGAAGAVVRLRHSEVLYDDGTVNVENLRSARATDTYILKGGGEDEIYEPRFTYHGFRYVELTGVSRYSSDGHADRDGGAFRRKTGRRIFELEDGAQPDSARDRVGHCVDPKACSDRLQSAR